MNPLEFLFTLVKQYAPVNEGRWIVLKGKAEEWYGSKEMEVHPLGAKVKEYGEKWPVQLGLAVLFIFAMRWVHDFMSPDRGDDSSKVF